MLYLDNAATTPLHPKALEAMMPFMTSEFGNPSGVHAVSRKVKNALETARKNVSSALGVLPDEIYFTSGGTESDNWAIVGALDASKKGKHIITTQVEHHGVYYLCKHLEKKGVNVTYLAVDSEGFIDLNELEQAITHETCLVSVIYANNEVGTINPLAEISKITKSKDVLFHTDAVQAVGHIPFSISDIGVDLLSLSAHKFYGPKGIGALYVRKGTRLAPYFIGGAQERNKRAGTENIAGIVGLDTALTISIDELPSEQIRLTNLRDKLIREIQTRIPHTKLNGSTGAKRLPGNVNISFKFIEGEGLLLHLDMLGVCASTGSACSSGALDPSHVLMAMGLSHELANGAIRFSLGKSCKEDDIDKIMSLLIPSVDKLRSLSPLYDDFIKHNKGVAHGV